MYLNLWRLQLMEIISSLFQMIQVLILLYGYNQSLGENPKAVSLIHIQHGYQDWVGVADVMYSLANHWVKAMSIIMVGSIDAQRTCTWASHKIKLFGGLSEWRTPDCSHIQEFRVYLGVKMYSRAPLRKLWTILIILTTPVELSTGSGNQEIKKSEDWIQDTQ